MRLKKVAVITGVSMCLLVMMIGTGWSARQLQTENVHLRGSSTVAPIAQQVAELYMKENADISVTVTSVGTTRGIKSLIDATCNMAMASADSDEEQIKHAKDNDVKLVKHVIAHDALVPIVNPANGITDLKMDDLRRVFSGEIVNWQQLGGINQAVVIVSYDGTSGNYETWKDKVMQTGKVVSPTAKIMTVINMKKFIQQTPGAIGYVALPYLDNTVKALKVEGISANADTVKSGQYPVSRELALYTSSDGTASVNKFAEYFLSEKGQQFVRQAGVIAVN